MRHQAKPRRIATTYTTAGVANNYTYTVSVPPILPKRSRSTSILLAIDNAGHRLPRWLHRLIFGRLCDYLDAWVLGDG